jgi:hypothetical protein
VARAMSRAVKHVKRRECGFFRSLFFFFAELGYIFTSHPMTTKIMLILTAPNTTFSAEAGPITADVHMPSACLVHA